MLQRQSKNNDLVIYVEGQGISKIEYYTDGAYKFVTPYNDVIYIPSSELQKMTDGQLRSTVYLSVVNENFPDQTQDVTRKEILNIWIGSEAAGQLNTSGYYTKDDIDTMFSNINGYTKEEIDAMIPTDYLTEIPSEYITEDELNSRGYLTNVPEEYITEQELNDRGYLTQHQDISHLASKDEIPDTSNLATRDELSAYQPAGDYATRSELPDTSNFLTRQEASNFVDRNELVGYATVDQIPDVSNLATKDEIPTPYDDTALTNRVSSLESTVGDIESILKEING